MSKTLKWSAGIIAALATIGSFILAANASPFGFSWSVLFYGLLCTFLFFCTFFALGSILEIVEGLRDDMNYLIGLQQKNAPAEASAVSKLSGSGVFSAGQTSDEKKRCPHCDALQSASRTLCIKCGALM